MGVEDKTETPELVLDDKTTRGFIAWYQSLPKTNAVVRFFDRKGFYTVHGENAVTIARQFYKTTAVVKQLGQGDNVLAGLSLNRNLFENVLRDLLLQRTDYAVELYEGSGATWKLARSATPGRLSQFEEELFRVSEVADVPLVAAVVLALVEGQRVVGVAYVDAAAKRLGACEFNDDEHFCGLEAVIVQLGVKECVVMKEGEGAAAALGGQRIRDVLQSSGAMASERPKAIFNPKHLEQDLGRLLKGSTVEQHRDVLERPLACQALAAVLSFSEATSDPTLSCGCRLSLYDPGRFMRLDLAAQRALNVFPQPQDGGGSFSLLGLMGRCRTPMGKRRLKAWLKQPLVDVCDIRARHDVVEALVSDTELRERLREVHFRGMPDVEWLSRKLAQRRSGLADLCQLYRASAKLPLIEEALRAHDGPLGAVLRERFAEPLAVAHSAEQLVRFEELLEAAVDLARVPEEYLICANYDRGLLELDAERRKVEKRIDDLFNAAAADLGLVADKTIKLEWHKAANTRTRCLRITQKEEKTVRKKLQAKYLLLETRKDGTKFTTGALKDAAERLQTASREYEELQRTLVDQVVAVAHTFVEVWEGVASLLAELDVLTGFAELAVRAPTPYVRPTMLQPDAGEIWLEEARHPCLEAMEGVDFIPNDCHLVRGNSWMHIITGPNMGGKSTYIRQVGAVVLMAQVGCWVPCRSARIAARDCIFARVGAGDCQQRGVSTFMAEMLETAAILKGATSRSLVIIDELGRGTSTYDGFGLAWAIAEHIMAHVRAPTLFATHFHELTELQGPGGVLNQHVDTLVDPASGRLTMLYRLKHGACDQSFGIHVAESARFPPAVVELAREKLRQLEGQHAAAMEAGGGAGGGGSSRKRTRDNADGGDGTDGPDGARLAGERARQFLSSFAALPLDRLGADAARQRVLELYQTACA